MNESRDQQEEKLAELYDTHGKSLLEHCYFRVSDKEAAKDLVQEVFLRYWRTVVKEEQEIKNPRALLFRIAHNLIIDHYRKRKINLLPLEDIKEPSEPFYYEEEIEQDPGLDEGQKKQLQAALAQINDKYSELFILRYINELSPKEISRVTGLSENTVSVRLHRAVKMLKDKMQ